MNKPSSLSLSTVLQPSEHPGGFLWTVSNRSVSSLCWGLQSWTQYSRWGLTKVEDLRDRNLEIPNWGRLASHLVHGASASKWSPAQSMFMSGKPTGTDSRTWWVWWHRQKKVFVPHPSCQVAGRCTFLLLCPSLWLDPECQPWLWESSCLPKSQFCYCCPHSRSTQKHHSAATHFRICRCHATTTATAAKVARKNSPAVQPPDLVFTSLALHILCLSIADRQSNPGP